MSTTDYQLRVQQMLAALAAEAPNIAMRMGQTALTLKKEESIRDGITVDGAYAEYGGKPTYKSSYKSKARNSAGSAYASSGGKGTWGEFRAAQGLKSDKVNLFYSGRMWTALRIISQSQNGYRYSILVGASDEEAVKVLLGNLQRYGNFLAISPAQERIIKDDAEADVADIVNRFL